MSIHTSFQASVRRQLGLRLGTLARHGARLHIIVGLLSLCSRTNIRFASRRRPRLYNLIAGTNLVGRSPTFRLLPKSYKGATLSPPTDEVAGRAARAYVLYLFVLVM